MSWAQLTLVEDSDIGALEPQATDITAPWGQVAWSTQRDAAKTDLAIWLERDHPDLPGVTDQVRDRWEPERVLAYTGSAYSDVTPAAANDTSEDLNLATIFTTAGTDRLYVGASFAYTGLYVGLLDSVNAAASVMTVKYWGDNQWTTTSATDGTATSGATCAKSGRVTWTQPTDWSRRDLNSQGEEWYWVELSVSAGLTAGTAATQILPINAPKAIKRCATWLSLYHICNGIALQAPDADRWQTKADTYLEMAKTLYSQTRVPLDVDLSGAVSDVEGATAAQGRARMLRG